MHINQHPELRPVNCPPGHNTYCGPAVVSVLTGLTTNAAARLIRGAGDRAREMVPPDYAPRIRDVQAVRLTFVIELRAALDLCGMHTDSIYYDQFSTTSMRSYLHATQYKRKQGVFILTGDNHHFLIKGDAVVCSKYDNPVPWADAHYIDRGLAGVVQVWTSSDACPPHWLTTK